MEDKQSLAAEVHSDDDINLDEHELVPHFQRYVNFFFILILQPISNHFEQRFLDRCELYSVRFLNRFCKSRSLIAQSSSVAKLEVFRSEWSSLGSQNSNIF